MLGPLQRRLRKENEKLPSYEKFLRALLPRAVIKNFSVWSIEMTPYVSSVKFVCACVYHANDGFLVLFEP